MRIQWEQHSRKRGKYVKSHMFHPLYSQRSVFSPSRESLLGDGSKIEYAKLLDIWEAQMKSCPHCFLFVWWEARDHVCKCGNLSRCSIHGNYVILPMYFQWRSPNTSLDDVWSVRRWSHQPWVARVRWDAGDTEYTGLCPATEIHTQWPFAWGTS